MDLSHQPCHCFSPGPEPVHGLHAQPLLDAGAQCLLVVQAAETDEYPVLVGLIFLPARIDLRDQGIKIRVWSQRPLGNQLLAAGRALLVPAPQGRDYAVGAESVEALLGGHCILQHVQADGAHEF